MSTKITRGTLLALLLAAPGLARAVPEAEANHPIAVGQTLTITDVVVDGQSATGAIVEGVVGNVSGAYVQDVDFFKFTGKEGDLVTVDIDGGWGGQRQVDTYIAVFGPAPSYMVLRSNDNSLPLDPGSTAKWDSRIIDFRLPADGEYTVGVTGFRRTFVNGGLTSTNNVSTSGGNGDYTLIISGVTPLPSLQIINIEIKPGTDDVTWINPKAKGKVPVALLGSSEFSVEDVDTSSLTFGHFGTEASLAKCGSPSDVNGDPFPDLVCHFENQTAKFDSSDVEGILRGELDSGKKFEGRGWLKVIPVKAAE